MANVASHLHGVVQVLYAGRWRVGRLESYRVLRGVPAAYVSFDADEGGRRVHWFDVSNVRPGLPDDAARRAGSG
jgi:hypothetical protein